MTFFSFLVPLAHLQNTAPAIEQRKFDHQLEITNKDEFGDIANVFQNVMHDSQELEVAKVVQEGLFP
jgi:nitrate/nitrite-specific signal transduction histidine kinase